MVCISSSKFSFLLALHIDVHAFESLKALLDNYMLDINEEMAVLGLPRILT
jgi:hypothetical protein